MKMCDKTIKILKNFSSINQSMLFRTGSIIRTKHFDGSREIHAYFDCIIDPDSKRYLSEDYMFCQWARKIGLKIWMCPWMKLTHQGAYMFGGSLIDLAQIGAAATADPAQLGNNKKPLAK